jgi:ribosomal protein S18 acetylase RimI-like enzyme
VNIKLGLSSPTSSQCEQLARLIYASGSGLFDLLFGGSGKAVEYLNKACRQADGQFGYRSHYVASPIEAETPETNKAISGCMTLWTSSPSQEYVDSTLFSLGKYLNTQQIQTLSRLNQALQATLRPPLDNEMCIGHLSVADSFKRQGLASEFCELAVNCAKQENKQVLVLDVQSTNNNAIACYQKFGFKQHDQVKLDYTDLVFIRMYLAV